LRKGGSHTDRTMAFAFYAHVPEMSARTMKIRPPTA
jgi:hypothetical protein